MTAKPIQYVMHARFVEGATIDELAVELHPQTDDERLLLRQFSVQAQSHDNLIRITGWGSGGDRPGQRNIRLSLYTPPAKPDPCCPHPVERHAYNGCADCGCAVTWPEHPHRELDESKAARETRLEERRILLDRVRELEYRLESVRSTAEAALKPTKED